MLDWVNERLDQLDLRAAMEHQAATNSPETHKLLEDYCKEWLDNDGPEKNAAYKGDWGPLERKYPTLRGWLKLPKQSRGKHPRPRVLGDADMAAIDVHRIRAIWRETYGLVQRSSSDGPLAVEIASDRHNVKIELIESKLKSRTKTAV